MTISKLSIDFGTTNTAAAFVDRHGNLHEVRLSHTSTLMPSAVFADGDNLVVGAAAINLSATRPDAYEPNPKRRLREPNILLGDVRYKTTKLAAAVLRSAITTASTVHGGPFDQVILTHPDGWAGHMQARLRKAATRTGLHPQQITLITEAQAAAHFYSTNHDFPDDPRLCVFDFGAGTCDVAVLDRTPSGQYIVAASDGLEDLGGTDIDSRVYDWVLRHITANTPHIVGQIRSPHAALTLIDRVRDAKESLSTANRAIIPVPGGEPIQLTRNEFDSLIYRDVQRAVALTQRVITAANRSSNAPVGQIDPCRRVQPHPAGPSRTQRTRHHRHPRRPQDRRRSGGSRPTRAGDSTTDPSGSRTPTGPHTTTSSPATTQASGAGRRHARVGRRRRDRHCRSRRRHRAE